MIPGGGRWGSHDLIYMFISYTRLTMAMYIDEQIMSSCYHQHNTMRERNLGLWKKNCEWTHAKEHLGICRLVSADKIKTQIL